MTHKFIYPRNRAYFDDQSGEGQGEDKDQNEGQGQDEGEDQNEGQGEGENRVDKTFNQKQVDEIIKKRLARERKEKEEVLTQLEQFKKSKSLNEEERTKLQEQIDRLQTSMLTKEELAAKQKKELETKYTKELETTKKEAEAWRTRFTTSTIRRAITDAAVSANAYRPSQIVALLEPATRLDEVVDDDNNPTGDYKPMVKFQGRDKDDKPVTLDLPIEDALKEMSKMEEDYGNLFRSGATGGVGGAASAGGGSAKVNYKDTASYIAARRAGKIDLSNM